LAHNKPTSYLLIFSFIRFQKFVLGGVYLCVGGNYEFQSVMIKTLIIYCLYLAIASCNFSERKLNCNNFRTGKFVSHIADDQYSVLERNDTVQIETNKLTGHMFKSRIKWTSACEYELSNFEESKNSSDSLRSIWQGKIIKTKIIKVGSDYCVYESRMNGVSMTMKDTFRIFK
jgi:hypothetical protein